MRVCMQLFRPSIYIPQFININYILRIAGLSFVNNLELFQVSLVRPVTYENHMIFQTHMYDTSRKQHTQVEFKTHIHVIHARFRYK